MSPTLGAWLRQSAQRLTEARAECGDPLSHAQLLAQWVLQQSPSQLYLGWEEPLNDVQRLALDQVLGRRLEGEPLQYLIREAGFWKESFQVGPGVLIPRRETECLIEALLEAETRSEVKVAELGAGCGNIGLSVLSERPSWEWHAFESSRDAAPFARLNQAAFGMDRAYHLHEADFFEGALDAYDWLVANPPYVATAEMATLSREVRREPEAALDGGADGLEIIRRLVDWARVRLQPGGGFLSEIGETQGPEGLTLLQEKGFSDVRVGRDYAGKDRFLLGRATWTH